MLHVPLVGGASQDPHIRPFSRQLIFAILNRLRVACFSPAVQHDAVQRLKSAIYLSGRKSCTHLISFSLASCVLLICLISPRELEICLSQCQLSSVNGSICGQALSPHAPTNNLIDPFKLPKSVQRIILHIDMVTVGSKSPSLEITMAILGSLSVIVAAWV